jgi:molybdenum cofactor synthesis domain-containing protein
MRPFTSTILFADALRIVTDAASPIARTERVTLAEADGRVAAADVVATLDVPPFDRAAMDGYAVRAADTAGATAATPVTLSCVGRVFTGEVPSRAVGAGECIEIATGAPMPDGADAVVMVEETRASKTTPGVDLLAAAQPRQHIGRRAADIAVGQVVVGAGQVLNPSRVGAVAAIGARTIAVYARPSVAVLSTGNEITRPGLPLAPGQIYDVNRFTIESVVRRHGGRAVALATAGDTLEALTGALDNACSQGFDIVVFSGGSSVGDRDLMLDALRARGEVIFHGVAVKPGKPTAFGRVGTTVVFGMPGYPTSCLSNAYMLLVPLLRRTARLPPWRPETIALPLARRIVSATNRHQFYTVRIADGHAEPAFKSSGDITSMANADGYIEIDAGVDAVEPGTIVTVRLF